MGGDAPSGRAGRILSGTPTAAALGTVDVRGGVVTLLPTVSGRVLAVHVEDNADVKAGEVLMQLDARAAQTQLREAEAALEAAEAQRSEARREVHLALSDIEMLVDPGGRAGRVQDVAQAGRCAVVQDVGDVDLAKHRRGLFDHQPDVVAEVERVGGAEDVAHRRRIDGSDEGDRRPVLLDEVIGVGLLNARQQRDRILEFALNSRLDCAQ